MILFTYEQQTHENHLDALVKAVKHAIAENHMNFVYQEKRDILLLFILMD